MTVNPTTWPENPGSEELHEFVFLIVDVIDSYKLFYEKMAPDLLLKNAAAMNAVYEHVLTCLDVPLGSSWEWNWAGDGGVFAFATRKPKEQIEQRVLHCAQAIAGLQP